MRLKAEDPDEIVQNASVLRLIFLGFIVLTPIITPGSIGAFTSVALPQMHLSLDEASWFGCIVSITEPLGTLFIGLIIDKYGRRISMLSSTIPNTIGWFLLADKSASSTQLYLGRLLTGFAIGACVLPFVIYSAECITIGHVRIRNSVGSLVHLSMALGGLLVYVLSVVLPYNNVAFILGSLSTISLFLILIFVPESPIWLHREGRTGDAEIAQRRLNMIQPILQKRKTSKISTKLKDDQQPEGPCLKNMMCYLANIRRREVYKPLIISIMFNFFIQFTGLMCVVNYMVDLMTVDALEINPYILSLIGQVLQIIGSLLSSFIIPLIGIRGSSIVSFLGVSVGLIVFAFSLLYEDSSTSNIFNYLHIVSIWTIMLLAMGVLGISGAILGEIFPLGAKGFASLALLAGSAFNFTVLKIFPYMLAQYRNETFFVFSFVGVCGTVFIATCLPETVGKTMEEIRRGFR